MSRRSTLILFSLALLLPGQALALGLGEIELKSALNQPFLADVELISATDQDIESLSVELASADAFARYGLDRPFLLTGLEFEIVGTGSGAVLRITSTDPIREPFMSFLISAEWNAGRLLREYTVLLDPPIFIEDTPAQTSAPLQPSVGSSSPAVTTTSPMTQAAPVSAGSSAGAGSSSTPVQASDQPAVTRAAPRPRAPAQRQAAVQPGGTYGPVQRSETLWRIAQSVTPDGSITINQMMMALFYANPEAFYGNINRLKAGYVLQVPELDEIRAMTRDQAFADVRQHNEAWRSGVSLNAVAASGSSGDSQPQLRLVAPDGASGAGTGGGDPQASAELQAELDATRRALAQSESDNADLGGAVTSLADEVDDQGRLLSVKDSQIADLQQRLRDAGEAADVIPSEPFEEFADDTSDMSTPGVDGGATAEDMMVDGATDEDMGEGTAVGDDMTGSEMAGDDMDGATDSGIDDGMGDTSADAEADLGAVGDPEDDAAADEEPVESTETGIPPATGVRPPQKGLMDQILDNILYIGLGLGLLVGAVVAFVIIRRRGAGASSLGVSTEPSVWDDEADTPTEVATADGSGVTGLLQEEEGEDEGSDEDEKTQRISRDAMQQTIAEEPSATPPADDLESTMAAGAPINLDDSDAISEADFNMAYGLYDQAADGLRKALTDEPGRRDLSLKLLEVFFVWGNTDEFLTSATTFQSTIGGAGDPDWDKVVIMGRQICPDEDIFSGEIGGGGADVDLGFGGDDVGSTESDLDIFGDDDVFGGGDDAAPADAAPAADAPSGDTPSASGDEDSLGVDLDSLGGEDEATIAASEADLLDFELGDLTSGATDAPAESTSADEEDSLDLGINLDTGADLDAGTGVDMSPAEAPLEETQVTAPIGESIDTGLTALLDDDLTGSLGLDDEADAPSAAASEAPAEEFDAALGELSSFADTGVEDSSADQGTESIFGDDAEGSEASLDLGDDLGEESLLGDLGGVSADSGDDSLDLGLDSDASPEAEDAATASVGEVGTKLDLARAYVDMGDPDGARSILEEVLQEGDAAQRQEAQDLLDKMS
jgi:pilus assembly protein FimV